MGCSLGVIGHCCIDSATTASSPIIDSGRRKFAAAAVILSFAHHVTIPGRRIMTSSLGIFWSWSDGQIRPALLWSLSAGVLGLLLMCIRRRDGVVYCSFVASAYRLCIDGFESQVFG